MPIATPVVVAPRGRVFTAYHVTDTGDVTRCGLDMPASELWLSYEPEAGDRACSGCADSATAVQETLL